MLVAHIVTFNHERTIGRALQGLISQIGFELGRTLEIRVTDNASLDGTCEIIRRFSANVELIEAKSNLGFTGAHNLAIDRALRERAEYFLILNPDVFLQADALQILVRSLKEDSRCGSICPKLLRAGPDLEPVIPATFDTTGMFITPEARHFDRGSNEIDRGQYERAEYVFGASGAAMLCKASYLRDIALPPDTPGATLQVFDNLFFAYREDADLAWRSQWMGWKCRYEPKAVGYHTRKVLPENRAELPGVLNAYSVRNRFLLQVNNILGIQIWPRKIWRNLLVLGGVYLKEKASIPALQSATALVPVAARHRDWLKRHRRMPAPSIARFFSSTPFAEAALETKVDSSIPLGALTIIIVNYNSGERLEKCLSHLKETLVTLFATFNIRTCVVDNGSKDGSLANVRSMNLPNFLVHAVGKNLGFAGAINLAAREHPADAYLILNPDIILKAQALEALVSALQDHPDLAAVAPVLVDAHGRPQWQYLASQFPNLSSFLAELFGLHQLWPQNPWKKDSRRALDRIVRKYLAGARTSELRPHESDRAPVLIAQPAGACLLVRAKDFQSLGGFDETFWPAWFEDVDFCKRLSDQGKKCGVVGSARVIHEGGYSYRFLGRADFARIWYPNLLCYWRKHSRTSGYLTLRLLLPLALLLRALVALGHSCRRGISRKMSAENRVLAKTLLKLAVNPSNKPL